MHRNMRRLFAIASLLVCVNLHAADPLPSWNDTHGKKPSPILSQR